MNKYEELRNAIVDELKSNEDYNMFKRYEGVDIVKRGDNHLYGISFGTEDDSRVSPTYYVNDVWEEAGLIESQLKFLDEDKVKKIAKKMYDMAVDLVTNHQEDTEEALKARAEANDMSFEKAAHKILPVLVNTENNTDFLKDKPHRKIDQSISMYYIVSFTSNMTSAITNDILKSWNVDEDKLFETAINNIRQECFCDSVGNILNKLMGDNAPEDIDREVGMYVLTNRSTDHRYGASQILINDNITSALDKIKMDSAYILPSSIHELIITNLDEDEETVENLTQLIKQVNASEVQPDDKLSDDLYHYVRGNEFVENVTSGEHIQLY